MTRPRNLGFYLLFCAIALQAAYASTFKVVYKFTGVSGSNPASNLVQDLAGNFYGTTKNGGAHNLGTVFKVSPAGVETVLYSFSGSDGANPLDGLVSDSAGNFYGTTQKGGANGLGTVFKISASGQETVLYSFTSANYGNGGMYPTAGLIAGPNGLFYGTAGPTGHEMHRAAFSIDTSGNEHTVAEWGSTGTLAIDSQGNLYGSQAYGGYMNCYAGEYQGCGLIFKVIPSTGEATALYTFASLAYGAVPIGGLIIDAHGNLYGTASKGGSHGGGYGGGTVFKLTQSGEITVLHNFGAAGDGQMPVASLIMDSQGNLFGTTQQSAGGGKTGYNGSIFEIQADGTYVLLHDCTLHGGANSLQGSLFEDVHGHLWGTSFEGGVGCPKNGCGTVFELLP